MRTVAIAERRARLARRHMLSPAHRTGDLLACTDDLVCLHATDTATTFAYHGTRGSAAASESA